MRSEIRFLRTAEGVRVAYRVLGDGRNPRGRGGEPRVARGVHAHTVGATHVRHILEMLGSAIRAEATAYAVRNGLA